MLLRKRFLSLAAVASLAVAGVACSDDGGSETDTTTEDTGTTDDTLTEDTGTEEEMTEDLGGDTGADEEMTDDTMTEEEGAS